MKLLKKMLCFLTVFSLLVGGLNVQHVNAAELTANDYVRQLISYYKNYQDDAATDIERVLGELKQVDEGKGEAWENIMNYWSTVNSDGFVNVGTVPTGLPTDNSVAVVILGFALNSDGTMKPELIGRLQTGLDIANAYPNSYVVVTGGGTAANNPNVTEGGLMGEWLLEQGLSEERLIVENRAPDTVGNAKYTYEILKQEYPQVQSVVLVTSDYHVPRGCILYYSKFVLDALATGGEPLTIISNGGYETGSNGYESISLQANGVCSVAGISSSSLPSVSLSVLESLTVTQESVYVQGEELNLTVTANYDSGYSKDVTDLVTITGFDKNSDASQTVTVSYTENNMTITGELTLNETEKVINDYESKIATLIAEVDELDLTAYTSSTREVLEYAYDNAVAVLADTSATETELEDAYNALVKAIDGLKTRENVALNKIVTASHNNTNSYKITDGSKSTYWESTEGRNIPIEQTEVVIDLAGMYDVDTINVLPFYSRNDRYYHYDVLVSNDNTNWTKVGEQRSTDITTEAGATFELDLTTTVRYVKVKGVAVSVNNRPDVNNFHLNEVYVYGELVQALEDTPKEVQNLAKYGKVTVDSGANAQRITDGVTSNSYWGSENGIDAANVVIELPWTSVVEEINVITYYNNMSKWYTYEVFVSEDNVNWTSVGKYETEANVGREGYTIALDEPTNTRYVKVDLLNTNNSNFHLVEVEVFGTMDNIALDKDVTVSHLRSSSSTYAGSNITDGNLTTSAYWDTGDVVSSVSEWASLAPESRPYAIVNLDGIYELDKINVMTYHNTSRYYQYEIYTSLDGETYTLLAAKDDTEKSLYSKTFELSTNVQARYIKVVGTYNSANPGFHLLEIRATGTLVPEADADYTKVTEAKAKVPADLSVYTADSVVDLKLALANVKAGLKASYQAVVDGYAQAIEDAIEALVYLPADYSKVEEAKTKVPVDLSVYTDETVAKLNEALAYDATKNISEQATVDGYATAIEEAIDNLVLKAADYTKVDEAIAKVPADLTVYTQDSVKILQDALDAVVRDLDITKQSDVDAMALAIENALSGLVKLPGKTDTSDSSFVEMFAFMNVLSIAAFVYLRKKEHTI